MKRIILTLIIISSILCQPCYAADKKTDFSQVKKPDWDLVSHDICVYTLAPDEFFLYKEYYPLLDGETRKVVADTSIQIHLSKENVQSKAKEATVRIYNDEFEFYKRTHKGVVKYFESFNSVFTLNYDNTVEKLTENQLYHLHGDFETRHPSENPQNALGYSRIQSGQNIKFPQQFEHCNSTVILDFSGNKKYKYATNMTLAYRTVEQYKELVKCGVSTTEEILSKVPLASCEIVKTAIEKNLIVGQNYYFDEFEQLQGTLTVIGLSPQNDSHIFECINKSNLDKVIFYHFFGKKPKKQIDKEMKKIKLPINKKYEIKNVQDKWDELGVVKPEDAKYTISEKQLELVNALCFDKPVSAKDLICQLKSIPCTTKKLLLDLINYELSKDKYHTSPQSEKELYSIFAEFSKMLDIASLSPQVFFYFCFTEIYNK